MTQASSKVLVTGASGFIGSHFVNQMIDSTDITVLVRPESDLTRLEKIFSKLEVIEMDAEENWLIKLEKLQQTTQFQIVHFATSYRGGKDLTESNVEMPIKVINTLNSRNAHTFINTDTFFGKSQVEGSPLPEYTHSKKEFLTRAQELCSPRGVKFVNMRLEHIYGVNDNIKKFVPWLFRALMTNVKNVELTRCDQVRDFLNVSDTVRAYKTILNRLEEIDTKTEISVGSGVGRTVKDFVLMAKELTSSTSNLGFGDIEDRSDAMYSVGDPCVLHNLGWKPVIKLKDGMEELIQYMIAIV